MDKYYWMNYIKDFTLMMSRHFIDGFTKKIRSDMEKAMRRFNVNKEVEIPTFNGEIDKSATVTSSVSEDNYFVAYNDAKAEVEVKYAINKDCEHASRTVNYKDRSGEDVTHYYTFRGVNPKSFEDIHHNKIGFKEEELSLIGDLYNNGFNGVESSINEAMTESLWRYVYMDYELNKIITYTKDDTGLEVLLGWHGDNEFYLPGMQDTLWLAVRKNEATIIPRLVKKKEPVSLEQYNPSEEVKEDLKRAVNILIQYGINVDKLPEELKGEPIQY